MRTYGATVAEAAKRLAREGIADARLEAEVLLAEVARVSRSAVLASARDPLPAEIETRLNELVERRLRREPLAYILGRREFFGREFLVSPDVLIPRPETELLVHKAIALMAGQERPLVVDVGTGSGAIGLSVLAENDDALLLATDISVAAVRVARENARLLRLEDRAAFVVCDLLAGIRRPPHVNLLVASNLPYVPVERATRLQPEVREFEPHVALFASDAGLQLIGRLLGTLGDILQPGEYALLEIDEEQGATAAGLARQLLPDFGLSLHRDSSDEDRMLQLRKGIST